MYKFPYSIQTGADLNNCLALVKQKELPALRLKDEIARIENLRFIHVPTKETEGNRTTTTYCAEVSVGMMIHGCIVTDVEVLNGDDDGKPNESIITFDRDFPSDKMCLEIPNPVNVYELMGITQKQIDDAKEAMANE